MEIAIHIFNCIRASREQIQTAFQIGDKFPLDENGTGIVPDFWITALSCKHGFDAGMDFRLDAFNEVRLSRVSNQIIFPYTDYCLLHSAVSCHDFDEAELASLLQHSKNVWVENIRAQLLEFSLVEEGTINYLDQAGVSIHEISPVLLENYSETVVFTDRLESESVTKQLQEYCGESAESVETTGRNFITGLSSNCIHGLGDAALHRHLYQIAAVSINYALIAYERMWARYVAEVLLDSKIPLSSERKDRYSEDLLYANFLLQDATAENYLSSGVEGGVYQRVWRAWGGASVLKQAEARANQLASIFKDHEQHEQDRWESQIKFIAFAIAALGLVTLYTDIFDHLSSGNFRDRLVLLSGFALMMIAALGYLFRKNK